VTQAGELFSLADAGVASISVTGTPLEKVFEEGNQITATGSFTHTDGTTGLIDAVRYRVDDAYTYYAGHPIEITQHAGLLPDRAGHGTLVSLRQANDSGRNMHLPCAGQRPEALCGPCVRSVVA
jgi:hypothetical protein